MYDLVRILQIFHVQSVRARRGLSTCVRTSYEIVTPRKWVTISSPQGGADVMRAPVYSSSAFDWVTVKDLKTRFRLPDMLWCPNESNITDSDWTWKTYPQLTIVTYSNRCTSGSTKMLHSMSITLKIHCTSHHYHFPRSQNGVVPLGLGGPPLKEGNLG